MPAAGATSSRPMGEQLLSIVSKEPDREEWPFDLLAERLGVALGQGGSRTLARAVVKVYVSRGLNWLSSQHKTVRVRRGVWRFPSPVASMFFLKQALGAAELALSTGDAVGRPLSTFRRHRRGRRGIRAVQGTAIWGMPAPQPLAFLRDVSGEERVADRRPWLLHRRRLNPLVVGRFDRVIRSIEAILDEEPALGPYLLEGVLRRVLVDHPGVVLASTVRLERGRTLGRHFEWNMKRMQEIRDLLEIEGFPPSRLDHAVISNSRLMRKLRRRRLVETHASRPYNMLPGVGPANP